MVAEIFTLDKLNRNVGLMRNRQELLQSDNISIGNQT